MAQSKPKGDAPFRFPKCEASVLPDPSRFFSNHLLSNPLPTNSFFQNFTLGKDDQPEYFHPYLIKPAKSSLSISYPSLFHNSDFFHEVFKPDITISGSPIDQSSKQTHQISSFSDLGVNLDFPYSNLRFFLVRGSPFITFSVSCNKITISTSHEFVSFSGNSSCTKYTAKLNNNQTWPRRSPDARASSSSKAIVRISHRTRQNQIQKHRRRLNRCYRRFMGVKQDSSREEIISALIKDVIALNSSSPVSCWSYHYGKVISRAARLALIAEESTDQKMHDKITAYGDVHVVAAASTIMSLEIHASKMWWQVKEDDTIYPKEFTAKNRLVGVLWSTKRDSSLWFGDKEWKECRLGQQLLPLTPVSEVLFSDVKFVKQLVKWTLPALKRDGVQDGWKGFVYALESVYDKYEALQKIRGLHEFDDGNSLSNLLWWVHSRD
ncbi:unnamed protein product [Brassica rapa subsp. narinosa]